MAGGTILARAAAFGATVLAVRLLAQEAFALVVLSQAAVAYLSMMLDFGLTSVGMREIARNPRALRRNMGGILVIRAGAAAIGVAITVGVGVALDLSEQTLSVLIVFAVAAGIAALDLSWVLQGLQRMGLRAFVVAATAVLNLALVAALLLLWRDPMAVAIAYLIATAVVVVASGVLVLREYGIPSFPRGGVLGGLALTAIPLGIGSLLGQIHYNIDILLLGAMRSLNEVAVYGAIYKIVLGLLMLAGTYGVVCLPAYAAAHAQSEQAFRRMMQRNFRLISSVIVPIVILGTLAAESVAVFLFGEPYRSGGLPLAILLWSVALGFVSSTLVYALAGAGHSWLITWAAGGGAVVNVAINLVLIPRFGMVGAAWATVAADLVVLLIVWRASRRFALAGLSRHLLLLVPPAAAMVGLSLLLAPFSRGIGAAIGLVAFVVIAATIGVWTADDRRLLSSVIAQLVPRRAAG